MYIANTLLITLFVVSGVLSAFGSMDDAPRAVGAIVGILVWSFPFFRARQALAESSTPQGCQAAITVNLVAGGLILLVGAGLLLLPEHASPGTAPLLAGALILAPLALNVRALRRRRQEILAVELMSPPATVQMTEEAEDGQARQVGVVADVPDERTGKTTPAKRVPYPIRHWRGELPLPVSYWINGTLVVGFGSMLVLKAIDSASGSVSLQTTALLAIGAILLTLLGWLWAVVGIWRSAGRYSRTENGGWGMVAKGMVIFGALVVVVRLVNTTIPQLKELAGIASGNDPIGEVSIQLSRDGTTIFVNGTLREGSADRIVARADATPGLRIMALNSNGGRLLEAEKLARAVRRLQLDTYVEGMCASACTYVFLAGRDRAATPNAKIGFHQPDFPGYNDEARRAAFRSMAEVYREARLPQAFIDRIGRTAADDMWFPTRAELIAGNVVTRVSFGGETTALATIFRTREDFLLQLKSSSLFQAYEARFPGLIADAADRGWAVRLRGGSDADVLTASREAIAEALPKLLKTTDEAMLARFGKLIIDELIAARALSAHACVLFLDGKLDISKTLPKEISSRDQQLMLDALRAPPQSERSAVDPRLASVALQSAIGKLSQEQRRVLADVGAYKGQDALICNTMLTFYQSVDALPSPQRQVALRKIFQ